MSAFKLFAVSLIVTVGVLSAFIFVHREKAAPSPVLKKVGDEVYVTSQLRPENVAALRSHGIGKIVDLRPDGEAHEQATAAEIKQAAEANRLGFRYIPVPHGNIPASAVDELGNVLSGPPGMTLLYCRSGNRAVRTFALVEASRADGPDSGAIIRMAHDAGFSADDLRDEIEQRIARRHLTQPTKNP